MKAIALQVIEVERNYGPCGADRLGEATGKCVDGAEFSGLVGGRGAEPQTGH